MSLVVSSLLLLLLYWVFKRINVGFRIEVIFSCFLLLLSLQLFPLAFDFIFKGEISSNLRIVCCDLIPIMLDLVRNYC